TAEAEALYREGLETLRRHDPGHPEVGYALHNLADALAEAGRAAEAESMYLEAIAHKGGAMGEDHHEVAASRANLAALLASCGRRDEAYLLAQGAAARTEHLPSSHPVRVGCEAVAARLKPRAVPRVSESPSDSSSTQ
ncbi:MAG TPA: tetratricopeptide repeat protein, partial [Polyangiaceae bacterium]